MLNTCQKWRFDNLIEFNSGARMIVCVCNNISDREITQAVELGVSSMTALRDELGVATCCGSCHDCASEVLEQALIDTAAATASRRLIQPLISAVG